MNNIIEERNPIIQLLLSIVTCGIWSIVWLYKILEDTSALVPEEDLNPGLSLVLTIVTCGLYGIYLNYKIAKMLVFAGEERNIRISDNAILYIILSVFGFGLVNYIIMQSDLNKFA
ncbi:hypothetical protein JGS6364_06961 [[Clostridium] sordellii]|uniref:DUF4234 domain-containing protein n=1 Tax=Paraclostridium sordellii TaxID=1505 RepID=A0A0A1SGU7_PARSO|nr:DUF4234 domain-containing protein [Paeniclostridium sordellii]EPZ57384.1 hypothetical protein H477_2462 [[Clostridium] sordellii ATCC 9714] [Paeniclostridium sordellii ATCC 9714]MBS6025149.1 DUF4234 domain-containing protein [Paeniclostridium sordellii]QYE99549.1 DUF4234 domain-containing protein [Paeniclostridium sordellii]CEJ73588.1 conserved hypothetical protein [[Clostridium] sordellii] [Paeniclostridium sordellii]CEK30050.1 hypothetical protein JGS6364_06961 [[Clostridium] sordellii] [